MNMKGITNENHLIHILEESVIEKDENFIDALQASNMKYSIKRKAALDDVLQYITRPDLLPFDQSKIAKECYQEWKLMP